MTTNTQDQTFSPDDAEQLKTIEREAIAQEILGFLKRPAAAQAEEFERVEWLWAGIHGAASQGHSIARRLLNQVEHCLSVGFFDRLAKWSEHQANGRDERARQVVRELAHEVAPVVWRETLEFSERGARAYQTFQAEGRRIAAGFADTNSAKLKPAPTPAEVGDLARRLFEALFLPNGPDESAMTEAAKKNSILRDAMRAYEECRVNLNDLSQRNGATRADYVAGSDPSSETDLEKELYREAKRQPAVTYARTFAFYWPTLVYEWQGQDAAALGVRRALAGTLKAEARARTPEAAARLREAVATELARDEFVENVVWPWPVEHEEVEADGMAAPLARLLSYLRARFCPEAGGPALKRLKELERQGKQTLSDWKALERLEGIDPPESPWQALTPTLAASVVAQVVWFDRVGGELERESSSTTALVTTVHAGLGAIWRRDATQKEFNLLAASGESVAWLAVSSTESASHLFGAATTLTFHRLIRHLPEQSFRLWRSGRPDADVTIEGGFSGLAEALGASSKRAAEEVKQALDLGASLRRTWANGSEARGLWTYVSRAAAPGRSASLTVTLSPIIRPQYAHQLPDGTSRVLVPIVEIPALVGNRKSYGAQAALQWAVLARLVEGRTERAREGGVTFTDSTWRTLGAAAGLPGLQVFEVLKSWEGSFLERVGGERWNLADVGPYKAARRHLEDQAKLTSTASKRGRRAAAKRLKP